MPKKGNTTVTLPNALLADVDKLIKKYPQLGYLSRAEVVRDAIRDKIKLIEKEQESKSKE
jgi:metal-responsive CopG/Arc/MetJ family transcriptional regulator